VSGINNFAAKMAKQGGMAMSNNFLVKFEDLPAEIAVDREIVEYFCDEVQLPNINTATGTQNGLYTGLGSVDYPHTRVFTELQISFLLDANLEALKFLNNWYFHIFNEEPVEDGVGAQYQLENRVTRVRYKNEYASTIRICKAEIGGNSPTERQAIEYVLEKAYPYAIDAVPMQFGTAQLLRVTGQFKYQRHYAIHRDITNSDQYKVEKSAIIPPGEGIPVFE
tara:strand:+ start:46 stop:714 length:669 start_codon:yes stop_codon:yes gene_type:complete